MILHLVIIISWAQVPQVPVSSQVNTEAINMAEVEAERERKEKEMERNRKMEAERLRLEALQKVCYPMQDHYSPACRVVSIFILVRQNYF